jgi:hypothetical protein
VIVSHRHKFIFLKTEKTAGSSIEIGLSRFCGPQDIITPIRQPEDEVLRRALGYPGPQNCRASFRASRRLGVRRFIAARGRVAYRNHMPAARARLLLGRAIWDSYFKFAVERNPWDKVVSAYFYYNRDRVQPWPSLSEWVSETEQWYRLGWDVYAIAGRVVVDRVLHYERLGSELGEVAEHLGFPDEIALPTAKAGYRTDRRPYQEFFDDALRRQVEAAYGREIALMGYQFADEDDIASPP